MLSDENKMIVRRFYEEVVNMGNLGSIENVIAPEFMEVHEGRKYLVGSKELRHTLLVSARRTRISTSPSTGKSLKANGRLLALLQEERTRACGLASNQPAALSNLPRLMWTEL